MQWFVITPDGDKRSLFDTNGQSPDAKPSTLPAPVGSSTLTRQEADLLRSVADYGLVWLLTEMMPRSIKGQSIFRADRSTVARLVSAGLLEVQVNGAGSVTPGLLYSLTDAGRKALIETYAFFKTGDKAEGAE